MELPPDLSAAVDALCEQGGTLERAGKVRAAIAKYRKAYDLLPVPRENWSAASWCQAVIGDCYFQLREFERAYDEFRLAVVWDNNMMGNSFVRKRRGEILLELSREDAAIQELAAAYMLDGAEQFGEDDPKYFQFLKRHLKPPVGREW